MRVATVLAALVGVVAATPASVNLIPRRGTGSTVGKPGPISDMIVNSETTINGTHKGPTIVVPPGKTDPDALPLPVSLVNTFGQDIKGYLVGTCANNAVCFVRGDGSVVYPSANGSGSPVPVDASVAIDIPVGATINFTIPQLTSARIWFAAGELSFGVVATPDGNGLVQPAQNNPSDPSANVLWGFVEFNLAADGTIYANVSYVDFVGLILGIQLQDNNGPTQTTKGLQPNAANSVCTDMRAQAAADGLPWDKACMTDPAGTVVRVLSIQDYSSIDNNAFANYWTDYVNQVYSTYSTQTLTSKGSACTASGDVMTCAGDSIPYNKPTADDIWGCNSGPFTNQGDDVHKANLAVLCAAFHRSTFLLDGGVEPAAANLYYTTNPTDHYSRIVHKYETDGRGYAFSYDDVAADGENPSGTVSSGNPQSFLVWIGGAPAGV